ncbi:autotransporter outer membrane beta-barrel domain-containing protein [Burkholderia contaminans]|uniref:autotransporter outer membrane beta-barrel domain-containing protein n=1 Tax=Burkholderia TaxID=32008 RepID=UPI000B7A1DDD|nr:MULTISPECIES: autotransporter outer membrane beta-barrel domain-containing protein [Burkholderia]MCI3971525.1 autotransporter outer membrane beta-barrel domain-containing protein [Burkholderia sp. HI4860]MDN7790805.1 autotransporter outer membrane beta-barrel domain-containing protein [Burkholderia contaminans]OXJ03784.1 autotransporter outer membrane beta-barrel domain-containing protein [Burkholderia sp. AU33647]
MNHSFRSIWNEATGCWIAAAETARARGKRSGGASGTSRRAALAATHRASLRIAAVGAALAALSAGSAYASTCGSGAAIASGGTCAPGSFSPTVNDNLAGSATVSGGDTVGVSGAWTGAGGDPGYTLTPIGSTTIVSGNPNQPLLSLGGKTRSVSTPDSITGTHTSVATYDSSAFAASTAGTTAVPVYHDVNGDQYVNARIGTVAATGGTLNVSIGNAANAPDAAGNAIEMAAKQTDLTFADGTGAAKSTVTWNSRNQIRFTTGDYLADGGAIGSRQLDVPAYAGTFTAFDGSTWKVTDAASLAAYNDFLVRSVQSGALGSQAAYDSAFGQAVTFSQQSFQYQNNVSPGDKNTLPIGFLSAMHGTGANATLQIGKDGQIDFRGVNTIDSSSAVLAENGAHFINDGRLSGDFTLVRLLSGASGVNNGVISSGYASGDNFDTSGSTPPNNFNYHAYTEGNGVFANGTGTSFVNHGVMNVGAWTLDGNRPDLQNYAVAVTGGATASNAGTINVGVNATTLDSQVIGGLVDGGSFTNEAGGTITLGRSAQYAPGGTASDVALAAHAYGILLGNSGTASNLGTIVIGSQTQNGAALASIGSASGTLTNAGAIVVNGAAAGTPLANVGMLAADTAATVTNTGTITLNGVNGIGIMVVGTGAQATSALSSGTIDVAGGLDPASGTRNYGVWAEGPSATATLNGALNLTGTGAIGVHARSGATINVGANAVPAFMSGTSQIGFYAYGAGSKINVAAQHLSVDTDDSTLFRVAGGAAYTGTSTAGALTTDVNGQRAHGVLATDAGTVLSTGNAIYNVNGANGIAIAVEGGAQGTIDAGATINLNAAGAIAGVVDGQAHDLAGANAGTPVATSLTNHAAVTSSTAGVTGFVAQNLGTLENRDTVLLTGAGSTGVVIGALGTVNNASTIRVSNGTGALVQGASATLANAGSIEADDGIAGVHLTGTGASVALSSAGTVIANGSADGVLIDSTVTGGGLAAGATSIAVGGSGKGIDNQGTNATIALAGTQIGTTGSGADGLSSTGAGARIATDAATVVRTSGDNARGFFVSGADSTLAANGTTVATTGAGSAAIVTTGGATALLSGAKITTSGATSDGLVAQNGGRIGDTGSTIASAAANGATADSGGVLALTGTTLKGATAGVLTSDTLANGATSSVLVDGGSVASVTGPAFAVRGGTADIAVRNGTVVTAGNGTLLDLSNGSRATFTASAVNLAGDIVSDASSTGNVFLANGTTLTGKIDPVALTVDNTSTWRMTGSSVLSSLNNAGLVAFAAPTGSPTLAGSYKTLTTGSYVGNGGTIALNTFLGADASPTDRVIVNGGAASGTTGLKIANTAGTGAQTKGDGIPVVVTANGGTTTASAFQLAGPVQAGAYEYRLYRGGQADANGWYLRSQLDPSNPGDPIHPSGGGDGGNNGNGNGGTLAYRPGVSGYALTPLLNADYGFSTLGKLHERVGDIYNLEKQQPGNRDGVWGRIGGQSLDANAGRFAADERTFFAQFGKDWTLDQAPNGGGSTHAGVTASIGVSNASFSDMARADTANLSTSTGSVEMHAQSIGGYWTKYLSDGTYFDSVGQVTHYGNRYRDSYGNEASQNGFGIALSQEVGKLFAIGALPVAVEPQAQLMYQYLKLNGFNDNVSAVSGTTTNALRGRVGVRIFRPNLQSDSGGGAATPYFTADVLHDFLSPGQTVVGGTPFATHLGRTWYELGVGVTAGFGKSGELYANAKIARNIGGDYRRGIVGQVGYRYSW